MSSVTARLQRLTSFSSGFLLTIFLQTSFANSQHSDNAQGNSENVGWPFHGLDQFETRHSPLTQIDSSNLDKLGMAWSASLDSKRGIEATPLVVGGRMYVTSTWSRVFALDAKTGARLWEFDPKVPKAWAQKGCCDVVNRGVAIHNEQLFVGTFDGRLIALDVDDGTVNWEVNTIDREKPYTITGAPRIAGDVVLIGNGGADFGVRGYLSAYDLVTGQLKWRFFTVPKSFDGPHEHPELEIAAPTWDPESAWEYGGGGTVWDSMAFDAQTNLIYVGTGNGSPWPNFVRSPAGGDNLFLSSIVALDADTGRMAWYYQTTPGDSWDYTATQHIILADILWDGDERQVLFQAPKNGFFYVIDRVTGELLSADKYVRATWASHVDAKTGRPVLTDTADYSERASVVFPATLGGHNWHPMSYDQANGLVFIPAQDAATYFSPDKLSILLETDHETTSEQVVPDPWVGFSILLAWDPSARKVVWRKVYPNFANAGVLSTASNLVIQGDADGYLNFYDSLSGELLRKIFLGVGVVAPPIAYQIEGEEYLAIAAGWGGANFVLADDSIAARKYPNDGKVIVLKLGGSDMPKPKEERYVSQARGGNKYVQLGGNQIQGKQIYNTNCGACHGWFGQTGLLPDPKYFGLLDRTYIEDVVIHGVLKEKGMPSFNGKLDDEGFEALLSYLDAIAYRDVKADSFSSK